VSQRKTLHAIDASRLKQETYPSTYPLMAVNAGDSKNSVKITILVVS
jgi:hypothetical protein